MTTAEKINRLRETLATIDPATLEEPGRSIAMNMQMARGLMAMTPIGDPFDLILPDDPNEIDEFIDDAIRLLLQLRGDDLPPFSTVKYGEVPA